MDQLKTPKLCIIYITINNYDSAVKLANILLEKRLVACSNILGNQENPITSIYRWEGIVETDKEIIIICKSKEELMEEIVKTVQANHPYTIPAIIAIPIIGGSQEYLKFVLENTKEPEK